ncbi:MAG TPA: Uma2 family endonuclease [Gemmatimonadota bacterium]|nr:Uma2 family endonuclease [Gemmatimonadota bacterium]
MTNPPTIAADEIVSLEEFQRMPEEDEYRLELVRGRIVREPLPGAPHGTLVGELFRQILPHVPRGSGRVVNETGFLLSVDPPTVRGPDLAYVAAGSIPAGGIPAGFWLMAPDLAIEVVSPSNTSAEMREKVLEYLAAGTRLVWIVDPATRSVAVYRSRLDIRLLTVEDTLDGADILPDLRIPVADLFAPLDSSEA